MTVIDGLTFLKNRIYVLELQLSVVLFLIDCRLILLTQSSSYLSGKNSFRVSMSGIFPMALPMKKNIREVVIPMVIWCRENTLKPRAMVTQ